MRVIDSSSLVKLLSREEGWREVEGLVLEGVVSLDLSVKEVASALWKKVVNDEMKSAAAEEILTDLAESDIIRIQNQRQHLAGAFRTAVKHRVTVYDALFIELAKVAGFELVTSDSKQAEVARKEGVKTKIL